MDNVPKKWIVSSEAMDAISKYLWSRPFGEVNNLVALIQKGMVPYVTDETYDAVSKPDDPIGLTD